MDEKKQLGSKVQNEKEVKITGKEKGYIVGLGMQIYTPKILIRSF